jgi:DNA phosphorothioation-dependent restriction protein DptG
MKTTESKMRRLNPTFRKNSCRKWDILSQTEMNEEYARLEKLSDTELSELMDGMDTDTSAKFVKNLVSRKINEILTTRGAA